VNCQKERNTGVTRRDFIKVTGAIVIVAGTRGCGFLAADENSTPTNTPETGQILVPGGEIPPADGYLLVDIEKCQGCLSCMLACSLVHEGVESLSLSRIQIMQDSFESFSDDLTIEQCRQCVDPACVQVCPTGIDIRDGLQYECIACSACIDACDDVMKKMDYDPGLIRYTTLNEISGKGLHILRPRVYLYTSILIGLILAMSWSLYTRIPVSLDVNRDRNILYREANNGDLENVFKLKIMNQDSKPHTFVITMEGLPGSVLDPDEKEITAASGETANTLIRVRASEDVIKDRSTNITIKVTAVDDEKLTDEEDARFLAPADWFR